MTLRPAHFSRWLPSIALLAAASAGQTAIAQEAPPSGGLEFSAGLGVINQPKYPGSKDHETRALPLLSASYGRFFLGGVPGAGIPAGIGVQLIQEGPWRFGIGLGGNLRKPRSESDSPNLRGLGDIDATVLGSVFGSYNEKWFSVRGSVQTDLGGKDQGTTAALDLDGRYPLTDQLILSAGPGVTWADRKYTQTFFGIDAEQSVNAGRAAYAAGSGVNAVRFGVGANYRITSQWGVGARVTASRLQGDAADSPITEKRMQNTVGVFTTYRF